MIKIAIIGGGAVGLTAASLLTHNKEFSIDIYEKSLSVGKKILASGNGRCNISNLHCLETNKYNNDFALKINLSNQEFRDYFKSLNLVLTDGDEEGRIYPYSYSAISVLNAYLNSFKDNVHIYTNKEIKEIKKRNNQYIIENNIYDYVIVGVGSNASLNKVNNYNYLSSLNHTFTNTYPSIHYLYVDDKLGEIENVRAKVNVILKINNIEYKRSGEILFKKDHLSGICIFELSTILARLKKNNVDTSKAEIYVDFLPNIDAKDILNIDSYFHPSLVRYLKKHIKSLDELKHYKFKYNDKEVSYKDTQVVCGGIKLEEINDSLESKFNPNLYLGGEILDIDGDCGGYNLHFAISCGYRIAQEILKKEDK